MRYMARKQNATTNPVNYDRILKRDGHICHICGQEIDVTNPKSLHFDHVVPLARGGTHSEENIRPSHSVCNLRKKDRLVEEMTPFQRRGPS
jgi:5-methylcytosine-specific restriction endonuclease McrA